MVLALIVACEVGFWLVIAGGLVARYVLGARRVGAALLMCAPLIDLVLLVAVTAHLGAGATASWHHGLAALYIGFSVGYGHRMVAWADIRFAHRFADGPAPTRPAGRQYTRQCCADVVRTSIAAAVAASILAGITWWVDDPIRTAALTSWYRVLGTILAVEIVWALSYTVWPRSPKTSRCAFEGPGPDELRAVEAGKAERRRAATTVRPWSRSGRRQPRTSPSCSECSQ